MRVGTEVSAVEISNPFANSAKTLDTTTVILKNVLIRELLFTDPGGEQIADGAPFKQTTGKDVSQNSVKYLKKFWINSFKLLNSSRRFREIVCHFLVCYLPLN